MENAIKLLKQKESEMTKSGSDVAKNLAYSYRKAITALERCEGKAVRTSEKDLRVCEVIASAWISVKDQMPPVNVSCLCLRNARRVCNLYFDGLHWYDDGFDSKSERQFTDVTHWVRIEDIKLPTTTN